MALPQKKTKEESATIERVRNRNTVMGKDLDVLRSALEVRRKSRQQEELVSKDDEHKVSLGPVGAIVDALINTAPEKLLELTDLDRNQVTLIPQVVVIDDMWDYLEQAMLYREDSNLYFKMYNRRTPETPDTTGRYINLLAQCRRSLGGKTQKALEDLALADLETRANEDGLGGVGGHDFED